MAVKGSMCLIQPSELAAIVNKRHLQARINGILYSSARLVERRLRDSMILGVEREPHEVTWLGALE